MKQASIDALNELRGALPVFRKRTNEVKALPGVIEGAEEVITSTIETGDGIDALPMLRGKPPVLPQKTYVGPDHERVTIPDFMAILNAVFPDQMRAFWQEQVKLAADLSGQGITEEEREKLIQAIKREKLGQEIEEENMIVALRAQGIDVDRRVDADPRVILFSTLSEAEKLPEITERWKLYA